MSRYLDLAAIEGATDKLEKLILSALKQPALATSRSRAVSDCLCRGIRLIWTMKEPADAA